MANSGDKITKQSMADSVNTKIVNPVNSVIVWSASSNIFRPNGSAVGSYQSTSPAAPALGPAAFSQSTTADYPDSKVVASTIVNAFVTYARIASRVRSVQVRKYYSSYWGSYYFQDETNQTSLANDQATVNDPGGTSVNVLITASGINGLLDNLWAQARANAGSTLTYTEYWCHSSCHGSYSARGRR